MQLWACRYKHILILLWAFVTDNIVNVEHVMSTAKSLCYMTPPALVSKCQLRKMMKSVRPTLITTPHHLTNYAHISYSYCWFFWSGSTLKFKENNLTSVRTAFITTLQPTIFKGSYWYIAQSLSWVGAWTLLIMASLFSFSRILWNFELLCIHIDWCLSLDSLLSYS